MSTINPRSSQSSLSLNSASAAAPSENLTDEDINILYLKIHSCDANDGVENFDAAKADVERLPPSQVEQFKVVIQDRLAVLMSMGPKTGAQPLGVRQLSELLGLAVFEDPAPPPDQATTTTLTTTLTTTTTAITQPPRPSADLAKVSISWPGEKPLRVLALEKTLSALLDDIRRGFSVSNQRIDDVVFAMGASDSDLRSPALDRLASSYRHERVGDLKRQLQTLNDQNGVDAINRLWSGVIDLKTRDSKYRAYRDLHVLLAFIVDMNKALDGRDASADEKKQCEDMLWNVCRDINNYTAEVSSLDSGRAGRLAEAVLMETLAAETPEALLSLHSIMSENNSTKAMVETVCRDSLAHSIAHRLLDLDGFVAAALANKEPAGELPQASSKGRDA